jgi:hypothetical protein
MSRLTATETATLAAEVAARREDRDVETTRQRCPRCAAGTTHYVLPFYGPVCIHVGAHEVAPEVGAAATISLYTDSLAAVITRVTATQVRVRRVATGERTEDTRVDRVPGCPVMVAEGILTAPIGEEETYRLHKDGAYRDPNGRRLRIGRSISRTDYRV